MKLLRYGMSANGASSGNVKPGMLDDKGVIRDLSGMVNDIAGTNLLPENINVCKTQILQHFRKLRAIHISDLVWDRSANSSASALTILIMQKNRG